MDAIGLAQRLLDAAFGWRRQRLRGRHVEDLPRIFFPGTVYILGEGEHAWAAAFRCPCGCSETVQLNLLPQRRPRWRVVLGAGREVSLSPSVWRHVGCRSHFVVQGGRIRWCGNEAITEGSGASSPG